MLRLMGLPTVQAPSEGEAQAAHMATAGAVWAAVSKDYDTLLFGAPRLLRFLTFSGREFLPGKGTFRPIAPELIDLQEWLAALGITREQLVDLAMLVGTDFNPGIKGIGPKKALQLGRSAARVWPCSPSYGGHPSPGLPTEARCAQASEGWRGEAPPIIGWRCGSVSAHRACAAGPTGPASAAASPRSGD